MKPQQYQYAQLPKYTYQSFERHYQTFDRNSLSFSYYPIIPSTARSLTGGEPQDDKEPKGSESEKETASTESQPEESTTPDEKSAPAEPERMYQLRLKAAWMMAIYASGSGFAHLSS